MVQHLLIYSFFSVYKHLRVLVSIRNAAALFTVATVLRGCACSFRPIQTALAASGLRLGLGVVNATDLIQNTYLLKMRSAVWFFGHRCTSELCVGQRCGIRKRSSRRKPRSLPIQEQGEHRVHPTTLVTLKTACSYFRDFGRRSWKQTVCRKGVGHADRSFMNESAARSACLPSGPMQRSSKGYLTHNCGIKRASVAELLGRAASTVTHTAGVGWSSRGSKVNVCVTMLALQCQC